MDHFVRVGCWAGDPGELLKGAGELGVQRRLVDRRGSFCRQERQEIASDKPDGFSQSMPRKREMCFSRFPTLSDAGVEGNRLG
jgi:hypothetical protein